MPGLGDALAAIFEAEIGQIERFRSADQLARYSGVAPVEDSSGARNRRKNRSYGRRRLNKAFYLLALNQIRGRNKHPGSVEARRYYNKKLAEGKAPKHALRCLMRRLVDIIYAMMRDRSVYQVPQPRACSKTSEEVAYDRQADRDQSAEYHIAMSAGSATAMSLSEP